MLTNCYKTPPALLAGRGSHHTAPAMPDAPALVAGRGSHHTALAMPSPSWRRGGPRLGSRVTLRAPALLAGRGPNATRRVATRRLFNDC